MKLPTMMLALVGMSGCFPTPTPIKAVPCIAIEPRAEALKRGLRDNPETPDAVGEPATQIILGTERVCED